MAYRQPASLPTNYDAFEPSLRELARRARRTRAMVFLPPALASFFVCFALGFVVRDLQCAVLDGRYFPALTAIAVAPVGLYLLKLSMAFANRIVRERAKSWRRDLAGWNRLDPATLEELSEFL